MRSRSSKNKAETERKLRPPETDHPVLMRQIKRKEVTRMIFNYGKLKWLIEQKFGSEQVFALEMGISQVALIQKLKNRTGWKQKEMFKACEILGRSTQEIPDLFFSTKL